MKKKKQPDIKPTKAFISGKIEVLKEQIERLKKFYIDRHDESFYMLHKSDEATDFEETADCLQESNFSTLLQLYLRSRQQLLVL